MFLQKYNAMCYWYLLTSEMYWLWKESLNSEFDRLWAYPIGPQTPIKLDALYITSGFLMPYVMVFLVFYTFRWEVVVHFVDIGGIVDRHYLNFLFIIIHPKIWYNTKIFFHPRINQTIQRHMELEIKFLYWDRHKNVTGISLLMRPSLFDKWVFDYTLLQKWMNMNINSIIERVS
jgi:hypothetical protein